MKDVKKVNLAILKHWILLLFALLYVTDTYSAITQVGTYTTNNAAPATSITINKPAGVQEGDFLILNVVRYLSGNNTNISVSGWTQLAQSMLSSTSGFRGAVFYRIATSSEPASYQVFGTTPSASVTRIHGAILAYRGVDTENPIDAISVFSSPSTSTSPVTLASITTNVVNTMVLQLGMNCSTNSTTRAFSTWTTTTPGTLSEIYDLAGVAGTNITRVGLASRLKPTIGTTGTTGTSSFVVSTSYKGGIMLALKPEQPRYFRSKVALGDWASASSWEKSLDGIIWVSSNRIPETTDLGVTIQTGHTINLGTSSTIPDLVVDGTLNINGAAATLTATSASINGTVNVTSTSTFTGTTIAFNDGSTYEHGRNAGTIPIATWHVNSNCLITGITTTLPTSGFNQSFGNFTWQSTGQTASLSLAATLATINGNLSVVSTGTGSGAVNLMLSGTGTSTCNVAGNFSQSGGVLRLVGNGGGSTGFMILNVAGDMNFSGGTLDLHASTSYAGNGTVNVDGNVNLSGSSILTETGIGTATFNFAGTTPTRTFTKTGGTISNTVNFNVNSSATVDFGTSVLDGSGGSFTLNTGATLITANTNATGALTLSGTNGSIQVAGTRTYNTSANYVLNGADVQYTGSGLTGAANLTLNNNGTVLTNALSVAGILNLQNGIVTTTVSDILAVTNTSVSAITGASTSNYISGPLRRYLPSGMTGTISYEFPVGGTSGYFPLIMVNPTTGTGEIITTVELKEENALGTNGVDVEQMSTTEYWSLTTSGNFTNTSLSASRPVTPGAFNSLAGSITKTGEYTSLNGSLSGNDIINCDPIGTKRFFVFAEKRTPPPVFTVSTTAISTFTYVEGNGPSSIMTFTVDGSWLVSNISIQAPANFEVSATGGAYFNPVSVLSIPAFSGVVDNVTVYVRMKAGLSQGSVSAANLTVSAIDATNKFVSLSGTVTVRPVITFTPATLSGFTYKFALGPSTQQSFNVSGTNLAANVILTPPSNYQISLTSGSNFVSTPISVAPSGGTVNQTVYVRLKSNLGVGTYGQDIIASSTYAVDKSLSLTGTVTLSSTLTLSNSFLSTFIYTLGSGPSGEQTFVIRGSELTNNVLITAPTNFQISLTSGSGFANSLTLIPSGGTLETTIFVRMIAGLGTNSYGPVNLTASSTGAVTKGVALKGSVVGSGTPTILVSNSTMTGFGYLVNVGPSNPQRITVSGASLGADITITPPSNYEISTQENSGFGSTSIVLTRASLRVNPTFIYIRLKAGLPPLDYNQTLSIVAGAVSSPVTLFGKVFASPLIAAFGGGDYCTGSTINLTSTGDDIMNRYWTGPNNYYTITQNPSISNSTPSLSGMYTVTGNVVVGGNLVINGDFEMGIAGFGSAYGTPALPYTTSSLTPEGLYVVVDLPSQVHTNFSSTAIDHTVAPGTKQMVINGNITPGAVVWTQSVPVLQNAYYEFNYWVQSVVNNNDPSPSQLQLYVNGVAAGPVYIANRTTGLWTQFIYNTYSGSNTILNLELVNQNIVAGGNDFSLDDIIFQQILPASDSTEVTVNNSLPLSVEMTYSPIVIYQNTPVSFTANTVNAGSNPVYSWEVNGLPAGTNSSVLIYTPEDGDVVTVEVTSSYPCSTNNPASDSKIITVLILNNYWFGTVSTDWGDEDNWTAGYVPATGDNVEYASIANIGSIAERDLYLDMNRTIGSLINATPRRLVIPVGKTLIVNNIISTDGYADKIHLKADSLIAHGSLVFNNPQNLPVSATVEMFSKATYNLSMPVNQKYNWQFFGIPLRTMLPDPILYGAFVRRKFETGTAINNHWVALNNQSVMEPFVGYEICQESHKFYYFTGELVNSDFSTGQLAVTSGALYPGQHLLANPYTAAIDIRQIEFGASMDNAIYLYNTGSFTSWQNAGGVAGTAPGTYVVIPKNLAGIGGISRQVPSMSAMLVKVNTNDANAYVNLHYNSVVMGNTELHRIKEEEADVVDNKRVDDELMASTLIEIDGKKSGDRLWIFTNDKCCRDFDNGFDGNKVIMSGDRVQIYAVEKDGLYQVNTVDNMHNTILAFISGDETEYQLKFTHANTNYKYGNIYLHDLFTNKITEITGTGTIYSFSAEPNTGPFNRFRILTNQTSSDEPEMDVIRVTHTSDMLYIHNLSTEEGTAYLYDGSGRKAGSRKLSPNSISSIRIKSPEVLILKTLFPSQTITRKIAVM